MMTYYFCGLLAVDSNDEDNSVKLLKDIIKLWIKLCGYSLASAITENYKSQNKLIFRNQERFSDNFTTTKL